MSRASVTCCWAASRYYGRTRGKVCPPSSNSSEAIYLNLDTVTVLRCEAYGWRVYFQDQAQSLALTSEEAAVLAHYLQEHAYCMSYIAVLGRESSAAGARHHE